MQAPVIIIVGPPKHGKTEARKILSELTYLKGESTSAIIYKFLSLRQGLSVEDLKSIPKEEFRPELIEAGDYLVGKIDTLKKPAVDDKLDKVVYRIPSALIRTLYMSGYNIIDGVRRLIELSDARSHLDWNGVRSLVIWVERPFAETVQDNTELSAAQADEVVINDGTIDDLRAKLKVVLERRFGAQDERPAPMHVFDSIADAAASVPQKPVNEL